MSPSSGRSARRASHKEMARSSWARSPRLAQAASACASKPPLAAGAGAVLTAAGVAVGSHCDLRPVPHAKAIDTPMTSNPNEIPCFMVASITTSG